MTATQFNQEKLEKPIADYEIPHSELKKILVAIDRESTPPEVMAKAMNLAKVFQANLMLFHCMSDPMPTTSNVLSSGSLGIYGGSYSVEILEQSQRLAQAERDQLISWLQSWSEKLTELGIPTEFDYKQGDIGHAICNLANSWNADLIILGRRGRSGLAEMLLGSVSNYVLHHAPCSVLVVQ